ncbi:DNA repair protein [Alphaproteobacteria bacterium KMM 3653]|uniref:DNA repair protein n=1 Tax=Harenicola maris TaxID=2841044 RepID=A0AAP2G6Z9_9RHOB|nr:DNA repair protein [Harenicola maris]
MSVTESVSGAMRSLSLVLIVAAALAVTGATLLAAFGVLPWLTINAFYGEEALPNAGMYAQIGLTILAIALCFFVPANARMMRLEKTHRDFSLSMQDIAQAYQICHAGDRAGAFTLSSEFDSVRERMAYLRDHPDLRTLEPAVLEVAAQMSHESRDLGEIYSDERMARARLFLRQRQQEIDTFSERMAMAKQTISEVRRWTQQIHVEEAVQATQLERLEKDLMEVLPGLGFEIDGDIVVETKEPLKRDRAEPRDDKVVPIAAKPTGKSTGKPAGGSTETASQGTPAARPSTAKPAE